MPSSSQPTHNRCSGVFIDFPSHFALVEHCFVLLVSCLFIFVFFCLCCLVCFGFGLKREREEKEERAEGGRERRDGRKRQRI